MSSTNCNGLRLTFRVRTLRLPAWVTLRALLMKSRSVLHYAAALLRYYLKGDRATGRGLAAASANATVKGSGLPQ